MPMDMKEIIAEAAKRLLMERNAKKLTVKDIVEECQITRQAFYYHFEDIPALIRWVLERDIKKMLQEVQTLGNGEQRLRYFFWSPSMRPLMCKRECRAITGMIWNVF